MNILILIVIYVVELLKYWVLISGILNVQVKRKWLGAAGLIVYIVISLIDKNVIYEILLIMYLIVYCIVLITMDTKILHRITNLLIALLIISCVDTIFGVFMGGFYNQYVGEIAKESIVLLTSSLACFSFIILLVILKQKIQIRKMENNKGLVKKSVPVLILLITLFLFFTIGGLNYAKGYVQKDSFTLMANVVIVISSISIVFLVWCMVYIDNTNKKMEEMLGTERRLKQMQLNYYKEMLEREDSTRKYRHDMNNHLICLNQLAKKGEAEAVIDYLGAMQNQMIDIQQKVYKVGNEILDAILNYHLITIQQDVKVEVSGYCNEDIYINNVDLCTIFANLIQNAVEELKKESSGEKQLKVIIKSGKEFMQVEIINSLSDNSIEKTDLLKTEKEDKQNHGIGLSNVNQTIGKNGGVFEIKVINKQFVATVILKNKMDN